MTQAPLAVEKTDAAIQQGRVETGISSGPQTGIDAMTDVMGVILAGTHAWGACQLERIGPRVLSSIANRPLIIHLLNWFADSGVRRVSICGNSDTDAVRRSLTNGTASRYIPRALKIDYYEDLAPRGPAGCIRDAGCAGRGDSLVVVDGSIIPQMTIQHLMEGHARTGAALTVVVSNGDDETASNGDGLTPTGIYAMDRRVMEFIPALGYQDIKETLIPQLHKAGVATMPLMDARPTPRVNGVDSCLAVNAWFLIGMMNDSAGFMSRYGCDYDFSGECRVHKSASVDSTAKLVGPILIDEGACIGANVTIIGPTSVGARSQIHESAVVCRSAIWDDCVIGRGASLDRCIVTTRSEVQEESVWRYTVFSENTRHGPQVGRWFGPPPAPNAVPVQAAKQRKKIGYSMFSGTQGR